MFDIDNLTAALIASMLSLEERDIQQAQPVLIDPVSGLNLNGFIEHCGICQWPGVSVIEMPQQYCEEGEIMKRGLATMLVDALLELDRVFEPSTPPDVVILREWYHNEDKLFVPQVEKQEYAFLKRMPVFTKKHSQYKGRNVIKKASPREYREKSKK